MNIPYNEKGGPLSLRVTTMIIRSNNERAICALFSRLSTIYTTCWKSGGQGQKASDCPSKKAINSNPNQNKNPSQREMVSSQECWTQNCSLSDTLQL